MSSFENAPERGDIDRILLETTRQHGRIACYPCRQRKVGCDRQQPCRSCVKRGHPQICCYVERRRPARGARKLPASSKESSQSRQAESTAGAGALSPSPTSRVTPDGVEPGFYGGNSLASILSQAKRPTKGVAWHVPTILGLENMGGSYPFMDPLENADRGCLLKSIAPSRNEVSHFFHCYRHYVYPFSPGLVDIEEFETDMCLYLDAYAAGQFREPSAIPEYWKSDQAVGFMGLLLAVLALGAHYSEVEYLERTQQRDCYIRNSVYALKLVNLYKPTLNTVQVLILLGNAMLHTCQASAYWISLGSTLRLAQTLGIDSEKSIAKRSESFKVKARALWSYLVSQDRLLSICYDRQPAASMDGWPRADFSGHTELSYREVFQALFSDSVNLLRPVKDPEHTSIDSTARRSLELIAMADEIMAGAKGHLQLLDNCKTLQERLEFFQLRLFLSFGTAMLCRQAITHDSEGNDSLRQLRNRAKSSLVDTVKSFLGFQSLSIIPLRSWPIIHSALSSVLLLTVWTETRNQHETEGLQRRVIEVFLETSEKNGPIDCSNKPSWLSMGHIRAIQELQRTLKTNAHSDLRNTNQHQFPTPFINSPDSLQERSQRINTPIYQHSEDQPFDNNMGFTDETPFSYLDSILNSEDPFDIYYGESMTLS